jgi:hypothetical protein
MGSKREIHQILLSNRKPVHIDKEHTTYISEPTSFRIYRRNNINCSIALKNIQFFKNQARLLFKLIPYLWTKALHMLTQSLYGLSYEYHLLDLMFLVRQSC